MLFLDEVGEMSLIVQAKLLRVLQEREYQRLGGSRPLKADMRVIAASNRNLRAAISQGAFREDLYYRRFYYETALSTAPTTFGSLRELVDPSHIVFGSDFPFAPPTLVQIEIQGLESYEGFDASTRRAIERDHSLALFPRLRTL